MCRSPSARQWNSPGFGSTGSRSPACCGIAERVPAQRFLGQHVEVDALNAAGGAGEAAVDHFVLQADGFEDLRALVALQRRDAHLGHHLEHALGHALAIRGDELVVFFRDRIVQLRRWRPLRSPDVLCLRRFDRFDPTPSGRCSRPSRRACHSDSNARYGLIASAP